MIKITKSQLKQLIKEEIQNVREELEKCVCGCPKTAHISNKYSQFQGFCNQCKKCSGYKPIKSEGGPGSGQKGHKTNRPIQQQSEPKRTLGKPSKDGVAKLRNAWEDWKSDRNMNREPLMKSAFFTFMKDMGHHKDDLNYLKNKLQKSKPYTGPSLPTNKDK